MRAPDPAFPVTAHAGVPVVTVPAQVTAATAARLRAALLRAACRHPVITVDMTATRSCDPAGITELIRAQKRARLDGGKILVAVTAPAIRRILHLTGPHYLIPVYTTVTEAITAARPGTARTPGRPPA